MINIKFEIHGTMRRQKSILHNKIIKSIDFYVRNDSQRDLHRLVIRQIEWNIRTPLIFALRDKIN